MKPIRYIFFFLLGFACSTSKAQNLDSLETIALKSKDSIKVKIYNKLAEICEIPAIAKYAEVALSICEKKIKTVRKGSAAFDFYVRELSMAQNNIGFFQLESGKTKEALQSFNESLKLKESINDKEGIATGLNNLAAIYSNIGDNKSAEESYLKSLDLYEGLKDLPGMINTSNNLAYLYENTGQIMEALKKFQHSAKLAQSIGDDKNLATSLNHIGVVYSKLGNIPLSLENYDHSLKIREKIHDKDGIANTLSNIGLIYQSAKDTALAMKYFQKSLKIRKELNLKKGIAELTYQIGICYSENNRPEDAKKCFEESLQKCEEISYGDGVVTCLKLLGNLYNTINEYDQASIYLNKALKLAESQQSLLNETEILYHLAENNFKQNKINEASDLALKSLDLATKISSIRSMRNAARILKETSKLRGDYQKAISFGKQYILLNDSINDQTNRKSFLQRQFKSEYEAKRSSDSLQLAEEKMIIEAEVAQKRTQSYFFYTGGAIVLILTAFMFNRYKIIQKQRKIIAKQKLTVELQKKVIDHRQKEIMDSILYARRIQQSLMPTEKFIGRIIKNQSK